MEKGNHLHLFHHFYLDGAPQLSILYMSHGHLSPSLSPFSPAGRISWGAVKISARIIRPGSILTPSVKVSVQLCVLALAVCVMLRPHASFKVSWRRSWSGCWSEWDTCTCLLWRGWHVFSVFMCLCVCVLKKSESKKETDRNTQTSARILWSFSRSTALFRGAFLPSCGHMWDDTCGQESLQRVTLASV